MGIQVCYVQRQAPSQPLLKRLNSEYLDSTMLPGHRWWTTADLFRRPAQQIVVCNHWLKELRHHRRFAIMAVFLTITLCDRSGRCRVKKIVLS